MSVQKKRTSIFYIKKAYS
uniref:Ribosomal protein L32 n=1 Tax=Elaeocarpus glabripetalus TaxID=1495518 RepID=A0A8F5P437_9ROSI|nr:ribosomal protein L32 [Elaeocarpus glabripetalus]